MKSSPFSFSLSLSSLCKLKRGCGCLGAISRTKERSSFFFPHPLSFVRRFPHKSTSFSASFLPSRQVRHRHATTTAFQKLPTKMSPRLRKFSPAKTVYALPERLSRSSAAAIAAEAAAGRIAAMSASTSASASSLAEQESASAAADDSSLSPSCFQASSLEKQQCPQQRQGGAIKA